MINCFLIAAHFNQLAENIPFHSFIFFNRSKTQLDELFNNGSVPEKNEQLN